MRLIRKLFTSFIDNHIGDQVNNEHDADLDCQITNNEYNLQDYWSIVGSTKYTDSHSDTQQLEKLLALVDIKKDDAVVVEENLDVSETNNAIIKQDECEQFMPGQPVYRREKFGREGCKKFDLCEYKIPRFVQVAIDNDNVDALDVSSPLSVNNYIERFQTLLWIEECHQSKEMERYRMIDVLIAKLEDYFVLEIPGLAEGRPSLMVGDRLYLKSDLRNDRYEGVIHVVRERDILFKLSEYLHTQNQDGKRYTIDFASSRTPFRRCHYGVQQFKDKYNMTNMVFPTLTCNSNLPSTQLIPVGENGLVCFNAQLNIYQKQAVANILRAKSRPAPYIVFGPPGTGKTVTIVEAILQIYTRRPRFKTLVCANSNSSADLCARRLRDSGILREKEDLIRVSAFHRMEKGVPVDLVDITEETDRVSPSSYARSRIVVTTCSQACSLNCFRDLFEFVIIDEGGHASEPECLIAMSLLRGGGCCVLAGDPHQLGPVCMSQVASQHGLGTSLMERLCSRSMYLKNTFRDGKMDYDENYVTKLRISYRSDARVMMVNSQLFYDNDLEFVNKTPKYWLDVFHVRTPLIFHDVKGKDRRERTNPSWFNPAEAIRCLMYAKQLYESGLRPEQLGIITPYRRQIDKMNLLFESCNLEKCKIATMEEFQGDEREVIIISTVRTRERRIEFDKKFQLGFLFNPKRFNVAISRAKWLVIVVGDSQILTRDQCWSEYMQKAHKFEDLENLK